MRSVVNPVGADRPRPVDAPDSSYVLIGQGTQSVSNGTLGTLDPTLQTDGTYQLDISATTSNLTQTLSEGEGARVQSFTAFRLKSEIVF